MGLEALVYPGNLDIHRIDLQEEIGLDVIVHGEPERNDMVQYFAENLLGANQLHASGEMPQRAAASQTRASAKLPGRGLGRARRGTAGPRSSRDRGVRGPVHPLQARVRLRRRRIVGRVPTQDTRPGAPTQTGNGAGPSDV